MDKLRGACYATLARNLSCEGTNAIQRCHCGVVSTVSCSLFAGYSPRCHPAAPAGVDCGALGVTVAVQLYMN